MPDLEMTAPPAGRNQGRPSSDPTTSILPAGASNRTNDTATAPNGTAATVHGYAVLVTVPADPEPRTRRRLFLSLHSAQRAIERSEARGLDAQLLLVRMIPEGVIVR